MANKRSRLEFESKMLPLLVSAHSLALWLLHHPHDAEDAVQDAYLKAFKAFEQWHGENATGWLLKIVRNTCMTKLKKRPSAANVVHLDAAVNDLESDDPAAMVQDSEPLPDANLITSADHKAVRQAVRELPIDLREVIVLREFEDLTYKQIADVTDVPMGTVMSRLSRARRKLRRLLGALDVGGRQNEM